MVEITSSKPKQSAFSSMHRYQIAKRLGDGTYGEVVRAINKQSGEVVAVKRMKKKYYSWDECIALGEVQSLRKLRHPNIVKLKEIIRENDRLHMVFEHMDCNLYELTKNRRKHLPESNIKNHMFQILQGLAFMHKNGYFHRDMKPENILVLNDVTKIADFGLAKEINARLPYTEYISTRWYRAPEVLLRSRNYNAPVDVFAVGCIMAELYMLRPLFPGSSESDMINKVCQVLGTPTMEIWPDGFKLATARRIKFPEFSKIPLQNIMPHSSKEGIELMNAMMTWNPKTRATAAGCLEHKYFDEEKVKFEAKLRDKELSRERAKETAKEQEKLKDGEKIKENDKKESERSKEHERPKKERERNPADDAKSRNSSSLSVVKGDQGMLSLSKKYKGLDTTESNSSLSLSKHERSSLRQHNSNRKESVESINSSLRNDSDHKSLEMSLNHTKKSLGEETAKIATLPSLSSTRSHREEAKNSEGASQIPSIKALARDRFPEGRIRHHHNHLPEVSEAADSDFKLLGMERWRSDASYLSTDRTGRKRLGRDKKRSTETEEEDSKSLYQRSRDDIRELNRSRALRQVPLLMGSQEGRALPLVEQEGSKFSHGLQGRDAIGRRYFGAYMDNRSSIFPAVGMAAKRQQPAAVARALGMQQGGMQVEERAS
uniref:non-specific serine/threonine protein kinase n=1 Tax=Hanusia phi TaxID=3032 RepID=A0A7S0HNI5_9CRYP|mmetsp:Transcript_26052/g.58999  ORF Transcript_26052/g.58999 Transcript_26052/m.58999 type:complete len:660 (+) Transcript_26052:307-2286(+)